MHSTTASRLWSATLLAAAVPAALLTMQLGAAPPGRAPGSSPAAAPAAADSNETVAVEGPFRHENLSVYLLRGPDRLELDGVITLAQALDEGKAVVRETGDVQSLVVENLSDVGVFVEAGDIVKGGQQDRVLTTDLVLPPKSGPIDVDAFCVERGRWSARGDEPPAHFASSANALPSRQLKLAAKAERSQGAVWAEVSELQQKLARVAAAPVTDDRSRTSLQLTLEHADVEEGVDRYVDALAGRAGAHQDVVGFAFAVNGELVSADVYGAATLARERWPKLLRAAAVEAFAGRDDAEMEAPPTPLELGRLLAQAERRAAGAALPGGERLEFEVASEHKSFQLLESLGPQKKMLHRALVLRDDD